MMKETNIQSQVTSTIAGDDGEAVAKSEQSAKKTVPENCKKWKTPTTCLQQL